MDNYDGIRHLFDDLVDPTIDEDRVTNKWAAEDNAKIIRAEHQVVVVARNLFPPNRLETIPEDLADALLLLSDDDGKEASSGAIEAATELIAMASVLPESSDGAKHMRRIAQILDYISSIACLPYALRTKVDVQTDILDDSLIDIDTKRALLEVVDTFSSDEGLDTTDIDQIAGAIADKHTIDEEDRVRDALVDTAKQMFDEYSHSLRDKYSVHPDDPSWRILRSGAAYSIASRKDTGMSMGVSLRIIGGRGLTDALQTLRIDSEEFTDFVGSLFDLTQDSGNE